MALSIYLFIYVRLIDIFFCVSKQKNVNKVKQKKRKNNKSLEAEVLSAMPRPFFSLCLWWKPKIHILFLKQEILSIPGNVSYKWMSDRVGQGFSNLIIIITFI